MTDETRRSPRRPFYAIAMGLVIILLVNDFHGYDLTPDPIGWLLMLGGSMALPSTLRRKRALGWSAALAFVVSVALWPPAWQDALRAQDDAVVWAALLPQVAWSVLLCLAIGEMSARDPGASFWWRYLAVVFVGVGALPILVHGAGMTSLESTLAALSFFGPFALLVLLFLHARKPWAGVPAQQEK